MRKIDRAGRARINCDAKEIRRRGQIAGWDTSRIAAAILGEISDVRPLEAWRFAHGWSRPEVIAGIVTMYRQARLQPPALNSSMLCRWEHGESAPSTEYADALCRLYQVSPDQLGLSAPALAVSASSAPALLGPPSTPGSSSLSSWTGASAVRESVQLALEAEGPGGGPMTRDQLHHAVRYYDLNYSSFPPSLLAAEVHSCRAAVTGILGHRQPAAVRRTLLLLGAWFSALLGNLAFHTDDYTGAEIHLCTAAGLAANSGNRRLQSWVLAAQSMVAGAQDRPRQALDLADQAVGHADTALRLAQAVSWAQLPALVRLGRADDARAAMASARQAMDASPVQSKAGRFGFDRAEFELHLAEAAIDLGDPGVVRAHAQESLRHTTVGRPGWAAATLVLARGVAADRFPGEGANLALSVLDKVPPDMLRSTAWRRLIALDEQLTVPQAGGRAAAELHERLMARRPPHAGHRDSPAQQLHEEEQPPDPASTSIPAPRSPPSAWALT